MLTGHCCPLRSACGRRGAAVHPRRSRNSEHPERWIPWLDRWRRMLHAGRWGRWRRHGHMLAVFEPPGEVLPQHHVPSQICELLHDSALRSTMPVPTDPRPERFTLQRSSGLPIRSKRNIAGAAWPLGRQRREANERREARCGRPKSRDKPAAWLGVTRPLCCGISSGRGPAMCIAGKVKLKLLRPWLKVRHGPRLARRTHRTRIRTRARCRITGRPSPVLCREHRRTRLGTCTRACGTVPKKCPTETSGGKGVLSTVQLFEKKIILEAIKQSNTGPWGPSTVTP